MIRVLSVPAAHPYVAHLGTEGVVRLPDPPVPGAPAGRWWPPAALEPAWIAAHAATFDLLHLHFGTESFSLAHLERTVAALRETGRPLVFTVHDLANPQLEDQSAHRAQLGLLVRAADALITLTPGAAAEIARRWGREATVIPHPHVLEGAPPRGRPSSALVVGLHLRDLRPGIDGPAATRAVLDAAAELRAGGADVEVRVELHDHVRDAAARDAVRALCAGGATLAEGPRPDDAALAARLAALDVSVLPYRHGTHSGWVELCWDLGVPVAVPAGLGHVAEQHPDPAFLASFAPAGLAAALRTLAAAPRAGSPARAALQAERREQRLAAAPAIARAQLEVYRRSLA